MRVAGRHNDVAAFFDVDGTLLPPPSLEGRLFRELLRLKQIPLKNHLLWVSRAVSLAPQGSGMLRHANKLYLRGLRGDAVLDAQHRKAQAEGAPQFFPAAIDTMAWHAAQGHAIVLVSGTLAPLARMAAAMLAIRLAVRGTSGSIVVRATELEEFGGCWTGNIVGAALFGKAKARAVQRFALEQGCDLERCYAYADSWSDRWMLEAVGRPAAVNPTRSLARMARAKEWRMLSWTLQGASPREGQRGRNIAGRSQRTWEHLR